MLSQVAFILKVQYIQCTSVFSLTKTQHASETYIASVIQPNTRKCASGRKKTKL